MSLFQDPVHHFRRAHRRATQRFKRLTNSLKPKSMRNEIKKLVNTVSDPVAKKTFNADMQSFFRLFTRYTEGAACEQLDWEKIKPPPEEQILLYNQLLVSDNVTVSGLSQLAVLKVSGGLGTSMGVRGAKCALEVKNGLTFLDLAVQQIQHLNTKYHVDVPLLLMTSFHTHEDTLRIVEKYQQVRITPFQQSKYPSIMKDTLLPCPKHARDDKSAWYPPGHGDLYNTIHQSGVLDQLLKDGKRYLFVSDSDNLGAVVDPIILQYMIDSDAEFLMEVTNRTKADVKGGTLIEYDGTVRLLEIAQVSDEHSEEFKSLRRFNFFNTNNLWINLSALKQVMDTTAMNLEIIVNPKVTDDGCSVIQLETAAGAAIKHFKNARGINVPRSRFLPVKSCSDLLLVKSDVYSFKHGQPVISEEKMFETTPVIKLDEHFKKIQDFHARFKAIPKIIDLDHLTVSGNVHFGRDVTLRGTVIIIANDGQRIDIPDGCVLENRLLSGNFTVTEL